MGETHIVQNIQLQIQLENQKKIEELKSRVEQFKNLEDIYGAKELAKATFRLQNEIEEFSYCGARCVIVNRDDLFRVTFNSATEFISYSFQ